MSIELPGAVAPEDLFCRYGTSKLMCRGPRRRLDKPYVAFLGGSETFGKFVANPFVALVEQALGRDCINLGSGDCGLDAYVHDPEILGIARNASSSVVQVMGAQNLSNRFYRVHPRRNDRFLAASPVLRSIYPDVDFTEIHFNKHLLSALMAASSERFHVIQDELQQAWLSRMHLLLRALAHKPVLLWLRYPDAPDTSLGADPLLIRRKMLDRLLADVAGIIEVDVKLAGETDELETMQFGPMQVPAASHLIGPVTHQTIADQLIPALRDLF